jgi:hypothetical protein
MPDNKMQFATAQAVGAQRVAKAAQLAAQTTSREELDALTINVTNGTAASAAATCLLFDVDAMTGVTNGGSVTRTIGGGVPYASVVNNTARTPLLCTGFQFQVDTPLQFSQSFFFLFPNINGNLYKKTIADMIVLGKQPTYLNETLLYVETKPFIIDSFFGIQIQLLGDENISLTFQVAKQYMF